MQPASHERATERRGVTRRVVDTGRTPATFHSRLESIGACVPDTRVTAEEVVAACAHKPQLDLHHATGIREKRICAPHEDSCSLALNAAHDCLAHSHYQAKDLELLIYAGISRFDGGVTNVRFTPSMATRLKLALGAENAMVMDLSNACAGMMSGLYVVDDFIRRGAARVAMVVSGEYISSLATNAQANVDGGHHLEAASLTLGDAGAAFIVERTEQPGKGILASLFFTMAEHADLCVGLPYPHGPGGRMFTKSREIHEVAILNTPELLGRLLASAGLEAADVDHVICHQTSVRAIEKGAELTSAMLGLRPDTDWMINVDTHGNSASTTHFVALRRFLEERRFKKGESVVLLTQASGLVLGATVFRVDEIADRYGNPA